MDPLQKKKKKDKDKEKKKRKKDKKLFLKPKNEWLFPPKI